MKVPDKIISTWSKLPPWAKGLVAVGGVVLTYMGIQAGLHHLQSSKQKTIADNSDEKKGEEKKYNGPDLRMF